jgi:cytidylate kinase
MPDWYLKWVEEIMGKKNIVDGMQEISRLKNVQFGPFITISRDPGSGGKPIAEMVAKKLRFKFYDKELIDEIAKSAKARKEIISAVDEKERSLMDDFVHNLLNPDYITEERYIKHLCKVVLGIAHKGKAVILEHGGNFITPDAFGLHVRITAPYRVCVSRAVQFEKVPYSRAREIIREEIDERKKFVRQYFNRDIGRCKYYDVVLNTTYLSIKDAADLIVDMYHRKFPKN